MRRLFMMVVVALGMSATCFAGNKVNGKNWNFDVNSARLCKYLQTSSDQYEEIANISDAFVYKVQRAEYSSKDAQAKKLRSAIYGNLRQMKEALTPEQYKKYICVINVTLRNKGLDTLLNDLATR